MGMIGLLLGVAIYGFFFATFLYLIVFIGGDVLGFLEMPKTIDAGPMFNGFNGSVATNVGLILLFAVQHTVMARQGFKNAITKIIPPSLERSFYVLMTSLILTAIYAYWMPMPTVVWNITSQFWGTLMIIGFGLGFGIVLLSTFLLNHFELFGLMQVWYRFKGADTPKSEFKTPLFYKHVRHPIYLGFFLALWCTPTMTTGHLLFAGLMSFYTFIGIGYEERDLIAHFGEKYHNYVSKVPGILPIGRKK